MAQDKDQQSDGAGGTGGVVDVRRDGNFYGDRGDAAVACLSTDLHQHHAQMQLAAASIDEHMRQMAGWKEELDRQMDVLRLDGIRLLERQKRLEEEEGRVRAQIEALAGDRAALDERRAALAEEERSATAALEARRSEIEEEGAALEVRRAGIEAEIRRVEGLERAVADRERQVAQGQAEMASRADALAAERRAVEEKAQGFGRVLEEIEAGRVALEAERARSAVALAAGEARLKGREEALRRREAELAEALLILGRESQQLHERRMELEEASGGGDKSGERARALAALKEEKARLEARVSDLERSKSEAVARAAALERSRSEVDARAAALERSKSEAEARAVALAAEVEELRAARVAVEGELAGRTRERDAALREAAESAARAEKNASAAEVEARSAREKVTADLGVERAALVARVASLEAERAELTGQREQARVRLAELERRCAELAASAERVPAADEQDSGEEAPSVVGEMEAEIARLRGRIEELESERDAVSVRAPRLGSEADAPLATPVPVAVAEPQPVQEPVVAEAGGDVGGNVEAKEFGGAECEEEKPCAIPRPARRLRVGSQTIGMAVFAAAVVGITAAAVYGLVPRACWGQAVVRLMPPAGLTAPQAAAWIDKQAKGEGLDADALDQVWTRVRADGYRRYDSKEAWLSAQPSETLIELDVASSTLAVRARGDTPADACAAANALAAAYAEKASRAGQASTQPSETGHGELAVLAAPSAVAVTDGRLRLTAVWASGALFVGLTLAERFQRAMAKDLRAIDEMHDGSDEAADEARVG